MAERHGGDSRGPASARRWRKLRFLHELGEGCNMTLQEHREHPEEECAGRVECRLRISPKCPVWLNYETVEADKIDPNIRSYAWGRVQPVCGHCNKQKGNKNVLPGRSIPVPWPPVLTSGTQMATSA